jgi:hypothetical protein
VKKALIHRYDNKPDILAVEKFGCSDVYLRARDNTFDMVIVIPTGRARTDIAVIGDAVTSQISPVPHIVWPGRPDGYRVRVKMKNFRRTSVDKVRAALKKAGKTWAAQWQVSVVKIDETML